MKKILFFCLFISFTFSAKAEDFGLEVGVRQQSASTTLSSASVKSQSGYQFGGVGHFEMQGPWFLRTGLLYTQRPIILQFLNSTTEQKISLNSVDIPLTGLFKFQDYAGVFAGLILSMNLDSTCSPACSVTGIESPVFPWVIGATFKFAPQLGATLYFETSGSKFANNLENSRAVGANLLFTFD